MTFVWHTLVELFDKFNIDLIDFQIIAIMQNRTRGLYEAVFRLVFRLAQWPVPEFVLTDYEPALQGALQAVCPGSRVLGCYFHYTQVIYFFYIV